MAIAMVTGRLKALRRTKLYDLFAAAPLITWYLFCAVQMLPSLAQKVALDPLYLTSLLLVIAGTGFAIYAVVVLGRSLSILPEARRLQSL